MSREVVHLERSEGSQGEVVIGHKFTPLQILHYVQNDSKYKLILLMTIIGTKSMMESRPIFHPWDVTVNGHVFRSLQDRK